MKTLACLYLISKVHTFKLGLSSNHTACRFDCCKCWDVVTARSGWSFGTCPPNVTVGAGWDITANSSTTGSDDSGGSWSTGELYQIQKKLAIKRRYL